MSKFSMEELLPIVAELTAKYTRNESTSVTYEKAEQLMGAVLYCIREYENSYQNESRASGSSCEVMNVAAVDARTAYEAGSRLVLQKIEDVRATYNKMILTFSAYENENYQDTVTKGIPGFFKQYDPKFAPQDTILTLDYPTLRPLGKLQGIDAIAQYVSYINLEQRFMQSFSKEDIIELLTADNSDYREEFYNICGVVLREVLNQKKLRAWIEQLPMEQAESENFQEELSNRLNDLLREIVRERYNGDAELLYYLQGATGDICTELITGYGMADASNA